MIDKERQTIIYEWLRSIGYTASPRAVNKLIDKLGYRKVSGEPPLLSDNNIVCYSSKTEFTRGNVGITVRTFKNMCFSNVSHKDIDENIDELLKAQRDADVRFYNG